MNPCTERPPVPPAGTNAEASRRARMGGTPCRDEAHQPEWWEGRSQVGVKWIIMIALFVRVCVSSHRERQSARTIETQSGIMTCDICLHR